MPEPVGFFTDTTVCIGCKACQVACHQWNDLPAWTDANRQIERHEQPLGRTSLPILPQLSGDSYDNTRSLSAVNWRHVKFIEQFSADANRGQARWLDWAMRGADWWMAHVPPDCQSRPAN